MHIFFSGIGGTAIGPLALIARQAGYTVSGSDKQDSQYIQYLRKQGINDITIGQSRQDIAARHDAESIDWYVYSSAVEIENPDAPELQFAREQNIHMSKRDELLNQILTDKELQLIAIAGTHGKTTTTAMVIWLFKQLGLPISYSVGAKIPFGDMGQFDSKSTYFVYECDEFDRNFLAYEPDISLITGVSWDHHEIFPTREDYQEAFRDFIEQSDTTLLWQDDFSYLELEPAAHLLILEQSSAINDNLTIAGFYNRLDAWLAICAVRAATDATMEELVEHINRFPGLQRRMEELAPNLFSDYAHTPEKIRGGMSVALETAEKRGRELIVIYEPLTNRRQHYMLDDYKDCFEGAAKVYWTPSYLAREDPNQRVIPPNELITHLSDPSLAEAANLDDALEAAIKNHLENGAIVVGMAGGGGGSLDEWLRKRFTA